MKLTLGFSPCPNDTFIFDALVHNKIDTEGLTFDVVLSDIQQLNNWAFLNKLDITKLSFHAFAFCVEKYTLLDSGSALGTNCGPILIKQEGKNLDSKSRIAIPGKYTTANMLLDFAFPTFNNKSVMLFSEIEDKIISSSVDAGVIIHENRFTYKKKGLVKVKDLGVYWEQETDLPIPLGGIVVKKQIPFYIQQKIDRVLRRSIDYAFNNRTSSIDYVRSYAQDTSPEVIDAHINLYVNRYTKSLGEKGRNAVVKFMQILGKSSDSIFSSQKM